MTTRTTTEHTDEPGVGEHILDVAIEQFGRHGFDVDLQVIAQAAGVDSTLVIDKFGTKEGLLKACDDHIAESIRTSKSQALQSHRPQTWFDQMSSIASYAPVMAYLVRSMQASGDLGDALMRHMIDNAEGYLEDGVRAGTVKPSRDPKGRARFLALSGGGGFLLYLHMHPTPDDMKAVLRDYSRDMILPALEVYTHGLLTDATMEDAFLARHEAEPAPTSEPSGSDLPPQTE